MSWTGIYRDESTFLLSLADCVYLNFICTSLSDRGKLRMGDMMKEVVL